MRTRTMYQPSCKYILNDKGEQTPWLYCDGANHFYKTYEECLDRVKKEIQDRKHTDQPVVAYIIMKVTHEEVEEVHL